MRQMNPDHTLPFFLLIVPFNIIIPPMVRSWKWSLSFRFLHQNAVDVSILRHARNMLRPSHPHNLITQIIFLRRTSYETFRATFFCGLLTVSSCWLQISPSAPCSPVSAGYAFPWMWDTEFHTNEKRQNHSVVY